MNYTPLLPVAALVAATCALATPAIAQALTSQDIGSVGLTGSSSLASGTWTLSGSGADIWGTADSFRFSHIGASGDLDLKVRVASQTNTNAWAKAGLMIRAHLGNRSPHVSIFSTPANGVAVQSRAAEAGTSTGTTAASAGQPRWLRLTRVGNLFTGYRSTDGTNWTVVGTRTIALPSSVLIGLAVTSHNNSALSTATFTDLNLVGGSTPPPPPPSVTEIILDNGHSGVTFTGTWNTATSPTGYVGTNYHHDNNTGKGSKKVRYAPNLTAGVYAVSIRYPAASSHSADVPVDVSHAQGLDPISINQKTGGGVWHLLGNYRFNAGTSGFVEISNSGTTGRVVADAIRFTSISGPSDVEVKANGLVSWNTPDGDGISCAECHTPTGYDIAVFDFDQADLRRATAPHLNDFHADRIFSYILQQRRDYPPAGGLKDVETFRPFQPGGIVLGGATSSNRVRDNAFADYLAANFLLAQAGNTVDTLAKANAALQQLVAIDLMNFPTGIPFNKWSESVSRSGANEGGRVAEWLPAIGQQPKPANLTQWRALVDAYVADPSDANFWAMFHEMDTYLQPDPVNSAPVIDPVVFAQQHAIFVANNAFAHNELNKARGLPQLQFTNGIRPFPDQVGKGTLLSFNWEVGDQTKSLINGGAIKFNEMPLRNQNSLFNGDGGYIERIDDQRIPWMWLGLMQDPAMWHSGGSTATLSLEYLDAELKPRDHRMHAAFTSIWLSANRGMRPNSWFPPSRWQDAGNVQNTNLRHTTPFLGYESYKNEEWDTGTPAYATYKHWIANGYRALALRQTADIIANGRHFNTDTLLNNMITHVRNAINWADPANTTKNNQIMDALAAAIAQYPQ
jgi:regulation of enolase protein 1 (concanavalin A-like superfamily)